MINYYYIRQNQPNSTFGGGVEYRCNYDPDGSGVGNAKAFVEVPAAQKPLTKDYHIYIIGSIWDGLGMGNRRLNAKVWNLVQHSPAHIEMELRLYKITQNFTASTVTWNNHGALAKSICGYYRFRLQLGNPGGTNTFAEYLQSVNTKVQDLIITSDLGFPWTHWKISANGAYGFMYEWNIISQRNVQWGGWNPSYVSLIGREGQDYICEITGIG
jgi:hypothetical protein